VQTRSVQNINTHKDRGPLLCLRSAGPPATPATLSIALLLQNSSSVRAFCSTTSAWYCVLSSLQDGRTDMQP
jgi:hypothetical protein